MQASPDRFKRPIPETLAKRASNRCSNPDCVAITSGPADDETKAISVGEAAHIYGAHPGSARFVADMNPAERSAITNGIWLCRNCHKIVDADPNQFPAALLFEWRLEHENAVAQQLGKTGERLRRKVIDSELEGFAGTTYLARQIVIDKPYAWEFRLTAELLRSKFAPLLSRWRALERGLYAKPVTRLAGSMVLAWFQDRITEMGKIVPALSEIINIEFAEAWGAPGVPGCPTAILRTCGLFEEACQQLLVWEEIVRFTTMDSDYEELAAILVGIGGRVLHQVGEIPTELGKIFAEEEPTGTFRISVLVELPDGWSEACTAALGRVTNKVIENGGWS